MSTLDQREERFAINLPEARRVDNCQIAWTAQTFMGCLNCRACRVGREYFNTY